MPDTITPPSTGLVPSSGLAPPTFVYQSAYTNESIKFDGKAIGATSLAPPTFAPIPVANFQVPALDVQPDLETLELKLDVEIVTLQSELQELKQEDINFETLRSNLITKKQ
jgi:hypothetical protein